MKKLGAVLLLLVVFSLTAAPALAGLIWCSSDPIVQLPGGGVVQIRVSVLPENRHDPFILTVTAPTGSQLKNTGHQINVACQLMFWPPDEDGDVTNRITAGSNANFLVEVRAKHKGENLSTYRLTSPDDVATWDW